MCEAVTEKRNSKKINSNQILQIIIFTGGIPHEGVPKGEARE